jgi:hypothetical protein
MLLRQRKSAEEFLDEPEMAYDGVSTSTIMI